MRRRAFIAGFGATVASPLTARAQKAVQHKRRIGALIGFAEDDPGTKRFVGAFLKSLADLGWAIGSRTHHRISVWRRRCR
jgi:hypothetical protein